MSHELVKADLERVNRTGSHNRFWQAVPFVNIPNTNTDTSVQHSSDHEKSQNCMMMTMIVLNKQQHISMVSRQTIASVRDWEYKSKAELNIYSLLCGVLTAVWLVCIGCQNNKKYPPITILSNICEYCPVPNTSIVLTLPVGVWFFCNSLFGSIWLCPVLSNSTLMCLLCTNLWYR